MRARARVAHPGRKERGPGRSHAGACGGGVGRRRTRTPDAGVSVILGAMLVTGILLAGYASYQATVVPILETQEEAAHMRIVEGQLADLKAELDRQLENRTIVPVARPVSLGHEPAGLLSAGAVQGSMDFEPGDKTLRLWSKRILQQEVDGVSKLGHPENWQTLGGSSTTVSDISEVESMRLKVSRVAKANEGDHVAVVVTDALGDPAGEFRVCVNRHGGDWDVHRVTTDGAGAVLSNSVQAFHSSNGGLEPYWVDLLDPEYRFDRLLAATEAPYDMLVSVENDIGEAGECPGDGVPGTGNEDFSADLAMTYVQRAGEGVLILGGGGVQEDDFAASYEGGTLAYRSENVRFARQTYAFENGGLVLEQRDGSAFKVEPNFDVVLINNVVSITLTVPSLQGDVMRVTGSDTGTVYTSTVGQSSFAGQATNLSVESVTGYPDLWAGKFRAELEGAGLAEGTQFTITTTATTAKVEVWGLLAPAPASLEYDLFVRFHQASIDVEVEG